MIDTSFKIMTSALDVKPRKIKVLCLSIWYALSMSRYFEKAFRHNENIELITVGPYFAEKMPWLNWGVNVPMKYAVSPDLPISVSGNEMDYSIVKSLLGDWKPDITLCIDAGIHWRTRPTEGLVAYVATDPHVLDYSIQRSQSDRFFNMQKSYSQPGDIWLPYAYSKYDHYPMPEVKKEVDAVLIGMPYPQRIDWVNQLKSKGVSVIFENGPIFDEARQLYNKGKIGLNWSSADDLNARAFELSAMKLLSVMNVVPAIYSFDFLKYSEKFMNIAEAVDRVVWAKEHPEEAERYADLAYQAVQGQTYDERVNQILKECNFL